MTDDRQIRSEKLTGVFVSDELKTFGWDTESSGGALCIDHAFIYLFLKALGMEQDLLFEISYHRCLKTGATPSISPVFIQTFLHNFSKFNPYFIMQGLGIRQCLCTSYSKDQ